MIFQKFLNGISSSFKKDSGLINRFRGKSKPVKTAEAGKDKSSAKAVAKNTQAVFEGQKKSEEMAKAVSESGDRYVGEVDKRRAEINKLFDKEVETAERQRLQEIVLAANARRAAQLKPSAASIELGRSLSASLASKSTSAHTAASVSHHKSR